MSSTSPPAASGEPVTSDNAATSLRGIGVPADEPADEPSLSSWLTSLDGGQGHLLQYRGAIEGLLGANSAMTRLHATYGCPTSGGFNVDAFCRDVEVKKVAHRRLLERWATSGSPQSSPAKSVT